MTNKIEHFYKTVIKNTVVSSEPFIIPNNEEWIIKDVILSASNTPITTVSLIFGSEIMVSTSGVLSVVLNRQITGDGVKELKLFLDNGYQKDQIMGGSYTVIKKVVY